MKAGNMNRKRLRPLCRLIISTMKNGEEYTISNLCKAISKRQSRIQNAVKYLEDIGVLSSRFKNVLEKDIPGRAPKYYKLLKNTIPTWYNETEIDYREEILRKRLVGIISSYKKYIETTTERFKQEREKSRPENLAYLYHRNIKKNPVTGESIKDRQHAMYSKYGIMALPESDPEKFTLQQMEFAITEVYQNKKERKRFILVPISLEKNLNPMQNLEKVKLYRDLIMTVVKTTESKKNQEYKKPVFTEPVIIADRK